MSKMYSFEKNIADTEQSRNHEHWNRAYRFFFLKCWI